MNAPTRQEKNVVYLDEFHSEPVRTWNRSVKNLEQVTSTIIAWFVVGFLLMNPQIIFLNSVLHPWKPEPSQPPD